MKVIIASVALALAAACTKGYVAPPLGPSPVVVTPAPTPTPTPAIAPLVVSLSIGRGEPEVGQPISFVASAGTAITHAEWTFGNGATQTTAEGSTAYAYPAVGTFTASVTVMASDGRTASDHGTVTVRRRESTPTPEPTPTPTPSAPVMTVDMTCTAKPAFTPTPCNVTVSYGGVVLPSSQTTNVSWDWGDGPPPTITLGPVDSHVYPQAGSYTLFATVTATTTDGTTTATVSKAITIL